MCLISLGLVFPVLGCLALARAYSNDETSGISFKDVAPESKIDYISNNNFSGRKYFPQPMCGGVAILDYDGDGHFGLGEDNSVEEVEIVWPSGIKQVLDDVEIDRVIQVVELE